MYISDTDSLTHNINFGYAHSCIKVTEPLWTNGQICRLNLRFFILYRSLLFRFKGFCLFTTLSVTTGVMQCLQV